MKKALLLVLVLAFALVPVFSSTLAAETVYSFTWQGFPNTRAAEFQGDHIGEDIKIELKKVDGNFDIYATCGSETKLIAMNVDLMGVWVNDPNNWDAKNDLDAIYPGFISHMSPESITETVIDEETGEPKKYPDGAIVTELKDVVWDPVEVTIKDLYCGVAEDHKSATAPAVGDFTIMDGQKVADPMKPEAEPVNYVTQLSEVTGGLKMVQEKGTFDANDNSQGIVGKPWDPNGYKTVEDTDEEGNPVYETYDADDDQGNKKGDFKLDANGEKIQKTHNVYYDLITFTLSVDKQSPVKFEDNNSNGTFDEGVDKVKPNPDNWFKFTLMNGPKTLTFNSFSEEDDRLAGLTISFQQCYESWGSYWPRMRVWIEQLGSKAEEKTEGGETDPTETNPNPTEGGETAAPVVPGETETPDIPQAGQDFSLAIILGSMAGMLAIAGAAVLVNKSRKNA